MAQQTSFTTSQVPGAATVTVPHPAGNGRCERCERMLPHDLPCQGVAGDPHPSGS